MDNHDLDYRLKEVTEALMHLTTEVRDIKRNSGINELWDNSDMVRNWKVSTRTLATWRSEKKISYVQLDGKIWYPKDAREDFIVKYLN